MGLIVLKKISLLFLLISASLLATSFAGRQWTSMDNIAVKVGATTNEETRKESLHQDDEATEVHERFLRANTKDYGTYNPSPTFSKPPYKLIPN